MLDRPIFIVGAARSGTSLLGTILSKHPDVAYWVEPKYVWRYRARDRKSDVRTAEEATRRVKAYIRKRFSRFLAQEGKQRFLEKTPSNCFRVPFIHSVFPDGLFIHLVRDGRAVALSAERKWRDPGNKHALLRRRLINRDLPLRELLRYIPEMKGYLAYLLQGKENRESPTKVWGPRFPGIEDYLEKHGVLETCAMQWRRSVEAALDAFDEFPTDRYIQIRYEDLCEEPRAEIQRLLAFLDLSLELPTIEYAQRNVRSTNTNALHRFAALANREQLQRILEPAMNRFGCPD